MGWMYSRPPGVSAKKERVLKDLSQVQSWREQGKSLAEIARRYQVHPNTLARYLKEAGETADPGLPTPENQGNEG